MDPCDEPGQLSYLSRLSNYEAARIAQSAEAAIRTANTTLQHLARKDPVYGSVLLPTHVDYAKAISAEIESVEQREFLEQRLFLRALWCAFGDGPPTAVLDFQSALTAARDCNGVALVNSIFPGVKENGDHAIMMANRGSGATLVNAVRAMIVPEAASDARVRLCTWLKTHREAIQLSSARGLFQRLKSNLYTGRPSSSTSSSSSSAQTALAGSTAVTTTPPSFVLNTDAATRSACYLLAATTTLTIQWIASKDRALSARMYAACKRPANTDTDKCEAWLAIATDFKDGVYDKTVFAPIDAVFAATQWNLSDVCVLLQLRRSEEFGLDRRLWMMGYTLALHSPRYTPVVKRSKCMFTAISTLAGQSMSYQKYVHAHELAHEQMTDDPMAFYDMWTEWYTTAPVTGATVLPADAPVEYTSLRTVETQFLRIREPALFSWALLEQICYLSGAADLLAPMTRRGHFRVVSRCLGLQFSKLGLSKEDAAECTSWVEDLGLTPAMLLAHEPFKLPRTSNKITALTEVYNMLVSDKCKVPPKQALDFCKRDAPHLRDSDITRALVPPAQTKHRHASSDK